MSDNATAPTNSATTEGATASTDNANVNVNADVNTSNTENTKLGEVNTNVENNTENQNTETKDDFDSMYDNNQEEQTNQNSNVPESYTFTDMEGNEIPSEDTAEFSAWLKDLGATQEQATKIFNAYVEDVKEQQKEFTQAIENQKAEQRKAWKQEVMSDPEIGGQNFEATKGYIKKAISTYGGPEVSQILNQSEFAFNPAFIRMFAKIGKAISSDNTFVTGRTAPQKEDFARRYFENTPEIWGRN